MANVLTFVISAVYCNGLQEAEKIHVHYYPYTVDFHLKIQTPVGTSIISVDVK